ncbi:MAG: crossover junction endodeoxyribonuclease RuvC [Methanomicrobiales archaeon]
MIVLGIDPGLARLGYGVIEKTGNRAIHITHGCITTSAEDLSAGTRLNHLYGGLKDLFLEHRPERAAVEKLFFSKNITSAMGVAEVRGIILLICEQEGVPVTEYTPNQVKQAITGSGRADKKQVQEMIRRLLHLQEIPRPDDAADGLSLALCHIHTMRA